MEHLGFTGTQLGLTSRQRKSLRRVLAAYRQQGFLYLHNGDCIGADARAARLWLRAGGLIWLHPPSDSRKRAGLTDVHHQEPTLPYLERNQKIVQMSNALVATPGEREEQLRSGTWATIRAARRQQRPVTLVFPDGSIVEERSRRSL